MCRALVVIALLPINICYSQIQNAVQNPGFEDYNTCPTTLSNIAHSPTYTYFPTVKKWVIPTNGTSDYFNTCSTSTDVSIPANNLGHQYPRTGNAYAGIVLYYSGMSYAEYIESKLSDSLHKGHKYFVSYFVSLAERSYFSTDKMGLHFSDSMYNATGNSRVSLSADICSEPVKYFTDSTGWQLISGVYTAKGGERWITMGKFSDTAPVRTIPIRYHTPAGSLPICYLYIDDVSVLDMKVYDTVFCLTSSSAVLTSSHADGNHKWSTGDTTLNITITRPGRYWCADTVPGMKFVDSFIVKPYKRTGLDTTICVSTFPVTLRDSNLTGKYRWNTGDTSANISVSSLGKYWRSTIDSPCVNYTDTFRVKLLKTKGTDSSLCVAHFPYVLNGGIASGKYLWNTGDTTSSITISRPGVYWRTTIDSPCVNYRDSFVVRQSYTIGFNINKCISLSSTTITNTAFTGHYLWSTGDTAAAIIVKKQGTYWRKTFDYRCMSFRDTFNVDFLDKKTSDSIICNPAFPITLQPGKKKYCTYKWQSGDTSVALKTSSPGVYWRKAIGYCVNKTDTIKIQETPKPFIGNDSTYCFRDKIIIGTQQQFNTYKWNTGDTSRFIYVHNSGTYILAASDYCGTRSDTININLFNPPPPSGTDTILCLNDTGVLLNVQGNNLLWYNDANDSGHVQQLAVNTTRSGTQSLYVTQTINGCESSFTPININVMSKPVFDLGNDTNTCDKNLLQIGMPQQNDINYRWNTGDTTSFITPAKSGTYTLQASNRCGVTTHSISMLITPCDCIWVPNAFSPNGDGRNDNFRVIARCPLKRMTVRVYDRFGEIIYSSANPNSSWDGTIHGVPAELGDYYYYISYILDLPNQEEQMVKGEVILIR